MPPRCQQCVGQGPVVGQEEQPLRVLVQPPHGEEVFPPQVLGQQVQHRFLLGVLGGGDDPRRLVQHEVDVFLREDRLAVHRHQAPLFHFILRAFGQAVLHPHPAGLDEGLGLLARPLPRGGQQLVQSFHVFHTPVDNFVGSLPVF